MTDCFAVGGVIGFDRSGAKLDFWLMMIRMICLLNSAISFTVYSLDQRFYYRVFFFSYFTNLPFHAGNIADRRRKEHLRVNTLPTDVAMKVHLQTHLSTYSD